MSNTLSLVLEIIIAFSVCAASAAALLTAKRSMKTPVPHSENLRIWTVIEARGAGRGLEQAANGILWLNKSGTLKSRTIIADAGLDGEAKLLAGLLAKNGDFLLCRTDEIPEILEGTE